MLHKAVSYALYSGFWILIIGSSNSSTFPFEEARPLYVGSRGLGMGNAYTALATDAEAGFWNPAGLVQWYGVKVFASTKAADREDYAFDSKCVAYSYRDTGFFWGNKIALRVKDGDTPDYTYYSLARKLSPYIAIGSSVKFKRRHPADYYQFFGHSPGYDLGFLWKPTNRNSFGMLVQNMGDREQLISVISFGLTHRTSGELLLSVDMTALLGNGITLEPHIGGEWQIAQWAALRAGVSDSHPTAGFGIKLSIFRFDYACIHNTNGNTHFLSGQVKI